MGKFAVTVFAMMIGLTSTVWAQAPAAPSIEVVHPWARATLVGAPTGVIYMTLVNKGAADDALIGVSTPVAKSALVHRDVMDQGVAKMRPVPSLPIKAGGEIALTPGKYHIMLTGMTRALKAGDSFTAKLKFAKSGERQITIPVMNVSGMGGMGDIKMAH